MPQVRNQVFYEIVTFFTFQTFNLDAAFLLWINIFRLVADNISNN
jgi:hypothetical protein